MDAASRRAPCLAAVSAILAGCAAAIPPPARVIHSGILIEDVTLVSPERQRPLERADVAILDGRITRIGTGLVAGAGVTRIDGRGRFLIPGLIDSHVHIGQLAGLEAIAERHPALLAAYRAQLPRAFLAFGFTTLVDPDLRPGDRLWYDRTPLRPRLVDCGRALRIAGGYGALRLPAGPAPADFGYLIHEPAQAERWPSSLDPAEHSPARVVGRAVENGAACIKVFVEPGFGGVFDWPTPRPETLRAIRAEARRRGVPLMIHATGVEAWRAALDARADVIAHGLWHWPAERTNPAPPAIARALIAEVARADIAVQPTQQVILGQRSFFDWSIIEDPRLAYALPRLALDYLRSPQGASSRRALARDYQQAAGQQDLSTLFEVSAQRTTATLRLMAASDVRLLFGSDTPGGDGIGNPPGLNGRLELQHWMDAGIPLAGILRAATLDNAVMLGLANELGSIETGKRADMLLLAANPLLRADAYDTIEIVFLGGVPIARESLRPPG